MEVNSYSNKMTAKEVLKAFAMSFLLAFPLGIVISFGLSTGILWLFSFLLPSALAAGYYISQLSIKQSQIRNIFIALLIGLLTGSLLTFSGVILVSVFNNEDITALFGMNQYIENGVYYPLLMGIFFLAVTVSAVTGAIIQTQKAFCEKCSCWYKFSVWNNTNVENKYQICKKLSEGDMNIKPLITGTTLPPYLEILTGYCPSCDTYDVPVTIREKRSLKSNHGIEVFSALFTLEQIELMNSDESNEEEIVEFS